MVNTKQNLTLQQKRFRAAVDYSSCICKSGGEAARGSLPALSPHSDQVISQNNETSKGGRAPGPGLKLPGPRPISNANKGLIHRRKVSSSKLQAPSFSSRKRQASSPKLQASSSKPQAASSLILDPS